MAAKGTAWSDDELRAAVGAYLEMLRLYQAGEKFTKKRYFEALARRFPHRTEKAFEWRMQNISHVLSLLGLPWLPGLPPARNTGRRIAERIESFLAESMGRSWLVDVSHAIQVAEEVARGRARPPAGEDRPARQETSVVRYRRDPAVAAWALLEARGRCEACGRDAPFVDVSGRPYLEVHHVIPLAEGGPDTVENVVAVCPNCHKELHFGRNAPKMRSHLLRRLRERRERADR